MSNRVSRKQIETVAAKHTPGPWSIYAGLGGNEERLIINGKSDFIASAKVSHAVPNAAADANARLIAAAPDLLAALKRMEGYKGEDSAEDYHSALIQARAAIAKAEGREVR